MEEKDPILDQEQEYEDDAGMEPEFDENTGMESGHEDVEEVVSSSSSENEEDDNNGLRQTVSNEEGEEEGEGEGRMVAEERRSSPIQVHHTSPEPSFDDPLTESNVPLIRKTPRKTKSATDTGSSPELATLLKTSPQSPIAPLKPSRPPAPQRPIPPKSPRLRPRPPLKQTTVPTNTIPAVSTTTGGGNSNQRAPPSRPARPPNRPPPPSSH